MAFDLSFAARILPLLADGAIATIEISVLSFIGALTIGLIITGARLAATRPLRLALRVATDFIRMTPVLIQVFFLYFWLPEIGVSLTPFGTGVVALSLHFGCYLAEVFWSGLESVDRREWDAVRSLAILTYPAYRFVILPSAIRPIVPVIGNYFILMFKETPVLASISVSEMLFVSSSIGAEQFRYTEPVTICGCLFLIMSACAGWIVRRLENTLATSSSTQSNRFPLGGGHGPQAF
jgi:polar amino acid transport system permease protein